MIDLILAYIKTSISRIKAYIQRINYKVDKPHACYFKKSDILDFDNIDPQCVICNTPLSKAK
jgi:hypothetical protein